MTNGKPVFLSYSSTDRERARELYERLVSDGYEVFLDQEDLVAGKSWSEDLDAALHACKVLVLCATNRSVSSRMVAKELKLADERDKAIIPVFLQNLDEDVQSKISWQTAGQQGVFLFGPDKEEAYKKLIKGLEVAAVPRGAAVVAEDEERSIPARVGPLAGFAALVSILGTWSYFNVISTLDKGGAQVAAVLGLLMLAPVVRYVRRAKSQRETETFVDAYKNSFKALLSTRALVTLFVATLFLVSFVTSIEVHAQQRAYTVRLVAGASDDESLSTISLPANGEERKLQITLPFTEFTAFDTARKDKALAKARALPIIGGSIELDFEPTVYVRIPGEEQIYLGEGSEVELLASESLEGEYEKLGRWPTGGKSAVRFGPPGERSDEQLSALKGESAGNQDVEDEWLNAAECSFAYEGVQPEAQERYSSPATHLIARFYTPDDVRHTETRPFVAARETGLVDELARKVAPWPTILVAAKPGEDLELVAGWVGAKFSIELQPPGEEAQQEEVSNARKDVNMPPILRLGRRRADEKAHADAIVDTKIERRIPAGTRVVVRVLAGDPIKEMATTGVFEVSDDEEPQWAYLAPPE